MDILLKATGLCKSYGERQVVSNVNLAVHAGEIVGLLGPNGAGKTTSFYMVAGLVRPDTGTVDFCGKDVSGLPKAFPFLQKRVQLFLCPPTTKTTTGKIPRI